LVDGIKKNIEELGEKFMSDYTIEGSAKKIKNLSATDRSLFYRGLRYLPSITHLACSELLLSISKQLNIMQPAVMHSYNLRMDMPHEPQFLFHWHQDITYLLGSKNSITYWMPLTKVNAYHGSIEVISESHSEGLFPYFYTGDGIPPPSKSMSPSDIKLVQEPLGEAKLIEAEPGDVVVFSQFILHRSTPNNPDQVRWAAQVRHSDLAEVEFQEAGFPFGDCQNIFHNDYLK
jgi:phytanoyl-CoA hydroxylase